jgi:hypothetical protein
LLPDKWQTDKNIDPGKHEFRIFLYTKKDGKMKAVSEEIDFLMDPPPK